MKRKVETKRIITGISPNYVKNWDVIKGIRENMSKPALSREIFLKNFLKTS